ncbi:DUF4197 family protein [Pseudodesulfovibrio sp. JC047]|uniref:DUF4197 domain-containing protein n=1 Tax=Pseudodesulfovibrio sp. JC047 TaxID=2683199 RepID=UPI0013D28600|nr:DUF4197 domain-containing protein [Pseudodesulfovibrio sp. JC047]NDV20388.1 DUF4197 family protein [Pseudodesulfovibrio sp. JC047]
MKMFFRFFLAVVLVGTLFTLPGSAGWGDSLKQAGDAGSEALGLSYTPSEADAGIREILHMGTDYAVEELGKSGGFSANPAASIPLPDSLSSMVGTSGLLSIFNTAAEDSVDSVGGIFNKTIDTMDIGDPTSMVGGSDTAITDYFEKTARPQLKEMARPVVAQSLETAGLGTYTQAISSAQMLSNATGTSFAPEDYVTDHVLDSMFQYIGDQEKDLRANGAANASDLLKKLF